MLIDSKELVDRYVAVRDSAVRLGNVVKFNWEMVPMGGGEAAGVGLEVLIPRR